MYGLPPETSLDFIVGQTLTQACFGEHDLILNFSGNISISIYSSIGVGVDIQNIEHHVVFHEVAAAVLRLLNKDVASVRWVPDGTVTLQLDDGSLIQILDNSEDFESYTISRPGILFVV